MLFGIYAFVGGVNMIKISELPLAGTLADTDNLLVDSPDVTSRVPLSELRKSIQQGQSIIICHSLYDPTSKVHVLSPVHENQFIPESGVVPVTFIPDADFHAGDKLRFNGQDCNAAYSNTDLAVADGAFRAGVVTSAVFQLTETSGTAVLQGGAAAYAGNAGKLDGLAPEAYIQPQESLFINWNFKNPVNQQNKTNYTEIGYCIDMWYGGLASEATTGYSLSITPDGLVLLPLHFIQQTFEQVSWEGEIVTFALLMDGMLYTASWKWNKDAEYELIANFRGLLIRYSGKYKYIQLLNSATDNLILQAAKAEKGAIFTGWPVWNYGLELARCQRYYFNTINKDNYASVSSAAYARTNNRLQCVINAPASMRTQPVPKIIGKLLVRTYNGAIIKEISADIASTNCGSSLPWALYLDITLNSYRWYNTFYARGILQFNFRN